MWITYSLIVLVALLHTYFMILEMFLWTKDTTIAKFGMTREFAEASATLAANQGLYNFFLAAGLVFALANVKSDLFSAVTTFFLVCIIVAGLYGGATVGKQIIYVQAVPAILALVALKFGV